MTECYSLLKQTVPENELMKIWMDLHFLVVKQLERLKVKYTANMKTNLELLLHTDVELYISTLSLAQRLKSVHDIFSTFFNIGVYSLFSPVLHVMSDTLQIPGGYLGTGAHQDWASTQGSLALSTVWIPITNTVNNFPLEVLPGSHRHGLLDGKMNGSVLEVNTTGEFEEVDAQFGDAVIISGFTVHRTGKGGTGFRLSVSQRFEKVDEETFIERGYPCAQKRVVDREIKWKPTKEQIDAVD